MKRRYSLFSLRYQKIIPGGSTILLASDVLILGGMSIDKAKDVKLYEIVIETDDEWEEKMIAQTNLETDLIILIKRGKAVIIPKGDTVLLKDDVLVITYKKLKPIQG